MRSTTIVLISALACAETQLLHPVRDEIVNEIKLKATSWKPKEIESNHLRHRTPESIKHSMGVLGTSPSFMPTEFLKTMAVGAGDLFKQVASNLGIKSEHFHLK